MRKYVDDTTISEVVYKGHERCNQQVVDDLAMHAKDDGFQLNERKCKELRISFARNKPEFDPVWVNRQAQETANSVKLLGLTISSDLKWNVHVSELVRKVSSYKSSTSVLHHMHSLCSGVRQPSFSSHSAKLSKRRPRKTAKTRYEDYLP